MNKIYYGCVIEDNELNKLIEEKRLEEIQSKKDISL